MERMLGWLFFGFVIAFVYQVVMIVFESAMRLCGFDPRRGYTRRKQTLTQAWLCVAMAAALTVLSVATGIL